MRNFLICLPQSGGKFVILFAKSGNPPCLGREDTCSCRIHQVLVTLLLWLRPPLHLGHSSSTHFYTCITLLTQDPASMLSPASSAVPVRLPLPVWCSIIHTGLVFQVKCVGWKGWTILSGGQREGQIGSPGRRGHYTGACIWE